MVRTSVLHDALKSMNNAERAGKRYVQLYQDSVSMLVVMLTIVLFSQVLIRPSSKVIVKFLSTMQAHGTSNVFIHSQQLPRSRAPWNLYQHSA
jgi:small subunit ribosomal protein S15Ae